MKKEILDYVVEKSKDLIAAASCSKEAKDAAQAWLNAVGTAGESEETKAYLAELEEDIVTVDGLFAFAQSEAGAQVFGGAEAAKKVAEHAQSIKAAGANTAIVLPARLWKPSFPKRIRCWKIKSKYENAARINQLMGGISCFLFFYFIKAIATVPAVRRKSPAPSFLFSLSLNTSQEKRTVIRILSLSMGTTTLAGPSCKAR